MRRSEICRLFSLLGRLLCDSTLTADLALVPHIQSNGWPHAMFDVQQCRIDLEQFAQDNEEGLFADSPSDGYSSLTDEYCSSEDSEESEQ